MKKSDKYPSDTKWTGRMSSAPSVPEDHGRPYFTVPFDCRLRFAINGHHYKEPTISFYEDIWDNELRRWRQVRAIHALGLSILRNLMALLEEELEK